MLTWIGFVGKLLDLIVNKLVGKRIDLALDEKKRAAKAFIRFHEATVGLEVVLSGFLEYIEKLSKESDKPYNRTIYTNELTGSIRSLDKVSNEFLASMQELGQVLYFFDKPLASIFSRIVLGKAGLYQNIYLWFETSVREEAETENSQTQELSDLFGNGRKVPAAIFRPTIEGNQMSGIRFTIPNDTLMDLDLNEYYNHHSQLFEDASTFSARGFRIDRVSEFKDSLMDIIWNNLETGYIGPKDIAKLVELHSHLTTHRDLLVQARENLREFIQKQFSLADVLYVTS